MKPETSGHEETMPESLGWHSKPEPPAERAGVRLRYLAVYWLPVFLYALAVFIQSSYPSIHGFPDIPHGDKLLHGLGYALMGVLLARAFRTVRMGENATRVLFVSALTAFLYGVSDELHQWYVPGRHADPADLMADLAGGLTGAGLYLISTIRYRMDQRMIHSLTRFRSYYRK